LRSALRIPDADNDGVIDGTGVGEQQLSFFHKEGNLFVDRTSLRDFDTNVICATVSSLSLFVVAVQIPRVVVPVPTPTPTPVRHCAPTPLPSRCTSASQSSLLVRSDRLVWRWQGNASVDDFGDPVNGGTLYSLCVYDESEDAGRLAGSATTHTKGICQNRSCWKERGRGGFRYSDTTLSPDGIAGVLLSRDRISVAIENRRRLPQPVSAAELFAQDSDVTVQLVNTDGHCWEASYAPTNVIRNLPHVYRAKSP
jgi:hypothetical protein